MRRLALAALCLTLPLAAPAAAQSVSVQGLDGRTATLSAAEVAALPRVSFTFDSHGERRLYTGALLSDVLAKVGAPAGKALRGPALATAVLVSASDGYQVAFGLAETDAGTRPNRIILADRADGAPLDAEHGPFQLVVEGDLRPARSIRMVTAIEIIPLGKPAASPAAPSHTH